MRILPEPPSGHRYIHGTTELVKTKTGSKIPGYMHPLEWSMLASEQRPRHTAEWVARQRLYREARARREIPMEVLDEWPPAGHASSVVLVAHKAYHSA